MQQTIQSPDIIEQIKDYWPIAAALVGWLVTHLVHNAVVAFQIKHMQRRLDKAEDHIDKLRDK